MTTIARSRHMQRFLGLVSLLALLPAAVAWAGIDPTPFRSGLFGVTRGQGIRISVLNTGTVRGVINPRVRVWDAAGTLLFEMDGGLVSGGTGTFVDFTPPPEDRRVQVRVEVEIGPPPDDGHPAGQRAAARRALLRDVIPTIEVFDLATGQTIYTMPFAKVGFNPQPEPPEPVR